MTEYFKQIFDSWGDRLRSPVLGSILTVFVLTNWQSFFYLFFADKPVRARLLYFDANTNLWTIYVLPIIVGVFLAVVVPWISLGGAFIAKFPRARLHRVQSSESQKRRIIEYELKATEEDAKAVWEEAAERRKIDAAKRLNEAADVSGQLKSEIQADRDEGTQKEQLSEMELEILNFAKKFDEGKFTHSNGELLGKRIGHTVIHKDFGDSHRDKKLLDQALTHMTNANYLVIVRRSGDSIEFEITLKGYSAIEE